MKTKQKKTIPEILRLRAAGEPITMLTAFDWMTARWLDQCGVDIILVGDSLGMTFKGEPNTLSVTVDELIYHTKVVARGVSNALIVSDMPFLSYQTSVEDAIRNCGRLLKEAGAHAVKMEGGVTMADKIRAVVQAGIPVMGHVGMQPQHVMQYGGYPVIGKDRVAVEKLWEDARAVEEAGVFSIVLESIPEPVATALTKRLRVPTIGIGAGVGCAGQVLVTQDLLGYYTDFKPKFVKQYAQIGQTALDAIAAFLGDVRAKKYPDAEHGYPLADKSLLKALEEIFE